MDEPTERKEDDGKPLEGSGVGASPSDADDTRRSFLKAGIKGALLLPYVAPAIETVVLSDAWANGGGDGDDDDGGSGGRGRGRGRGSNSNAPQPSPIANVPPPPPGNGNNDNDDDDDDDNDNDNS